MKPFLITKSDGRWDAYRHRHSHGVHHPSRPEYGRYATGFDSLDHLMDWLFNKAPGRPADYGAWKMRRAH